MKGGQGNTNNYRNIWHDINEDALVNMYKAYTHANKYIYFTCYYANANSWLKKRSEFAVIVVNFLPDIICMWKLLTDLHTLKQTNVSFRLKKAYVSAIYKNTLM